MQDNTITIDRFTANTIFYLADSLGGEQALEDFASILHEVEDEQSRGIASESLLKFYANARSLTAVLKQTFNE